MKLLLRTKHELDFFEKIWQIWAILYYNLINRLKEIIENQLFAGVLENSSSEKIGNFTRNDQWRRLFRKIFLQIFGKAF